MIKTVEENCLQTNTLLCTSQAIRTSCMGSQHNAKRYEENSQCDWNVLW